jgi:hypothetical protein
MKSRGANECVALLVFRLWCSDPLLFKQCFQLRRFGFFLAFESGRSEEKDTPNWSKYEPNPSKVQPRGPLGGAGGVKTAAGGKGTKKIHILNDHRVAFGAFSVPLMPKLVPFWTPLDFEGVQKGSNFVQNQYKV